MEDIIRYPRTQHLQGSCLQRGDDKNRMLLSEFPESADNRYIWEEKVDGANCAVSFDSRGKMVLQSRGHVLQGGPRERQFDLFKQWAHAYEWTFDYLLGKRYIMYGEWCYAKHTIFYDQLPHYFLEFDVYDKGMGAFLSTELRYVLFAGSPVVSVPVVHTGRIVTLKELKTFVRPSLYKSPNAVKTMELVASATDLNFDMIRRQTDPSDMSEGLYLKHEKDDKVVGRYKWVRSDFLQTILDSDSHWHDRPILANQLAEGVDIFGG